MEILRKGTVSAQFPKLFGNSAFPQNFSTRTSGEITVFFAVIAKSSDIKMMLMVMGYHKGVFRTQSNNYDGAFLLK